MAVSLPLTAAQIDLDYATFYGNEDVGVVEIYIAVPRDMFEFIKNDNDLWESNIFFRTALIQEDSVVALDEWSIKDKKGAKDDPTHGQKIPEISVLQAPPGQYELALYTFDLNTQKKYSTKEELVVPDYTQDSLMISDIQLGLQMGKTDKKNKFSKYFGYDILPNASQIFQEGHLKIFPFCEIYNLTYDKSSQNTYQIKYSILGHKGNEVKLLKEALKKKPGTSAVEVVYKGLDVSELGSGAYFLRVSCSDVQAKTTTTKTKKFYIIRTKKGKFLSSSENLHEDLEQLSEEELDAIFGPMKYLATNLEKKQYKKSDLQGKKNIINNFWQSRDPDPTTEINEARVHFENRVAMAENTYKSGFRKGWQSDRGRVLIKYGEPSEIERHPSSIDTKPYEIWHYNNLEGGVRFIFLDKTGFGDLELVHSTARNEMRNPDWKNMLR